MEAKAFAGIGVGKATHMCCMVDAVGNVLAGSFPFVCLDGTWLPARRRRGDGPGRCEKECAMAALGIAKSGRKEVLGFWIGPSESAEGWGKRLESLKERGDRRAYDAHRGRAAGDAGGHKAGIPRILPPKVPGPRREEHVLRGEEEGQAGHIGRFRIGLFVSSNYPMSSLIGL